MKKEQYVEVKIKKLLEMIKKYNERVSEDEKIFLNKDNIFEVLGKNEICKKCKGFCCTYQSKVFSSIDFVDLNNIEYLREVLNTGLISIQCTSKYSWVLKPRGILDKDTIISYNENNNQCIFYNDDCGCILPIEFRPSGCLLYINTQSDCFSPAYNRHIDLYNKESFIKDYQYHQSILNILYREYRFKNIDINTSGDKIENFTRLLRKE